MLIEPSQYILPAVKLLLEAAAAGDWTPVLTLMSNNSSVEQLQSDTAE